MCGFIGAVSFRSGIAQYMQGLRNGLDAIKHRGPDGTKEHSGINYYLAQNRLSIIDLSAEADQPLISEDGNVAIAFNGEIYNYAELRSDLAGCRFHTASDTEVIMNGYLMHGVSFFKRLRGIYAIAISDNRDRQKFLLVRDPAGVKPLYLYSREGLSVFGSELKALLPCVRSDLSICERVVKCYLNLGYCPEPYTVYEQIRAVSPGHVATISVEGVTEKNLIEYNFSFENELSYSENLERTGALLKTAVKRNLVADVDVAVALSGGIDSSLVYAFAHESDSTVKGLTVKFSDKEHDESDIAKIYAGTLGGELLTVEGDSTLDFDTMNKVLLSFDQPYADSSAFNVFFLTRASGKITKVLLGGDGGDELFNGYPSQTWLSLLESAGRSLLLYKLSRTFLNLTASVAGASKRRIAVRLLDLWSERPREMLYDWHSWFPRSSKYNGASPFLYDTDDGLMTYNSIFPNEAPDEFRNYIVFDYFRKTMLSDYLRKTDMMSMLNSVEYRVPFLDEDLTSFALGIPFGQKSDLRTTKKMLREIHGRLYPSHTSKGAKKGFTIPLDKALSKDDFASMKNELISRDSMAAAYVRKEYIEFLFRMLEARSENEHEISRAGVYQRILMLYSLNLWYRNK